MGEWQAVKRISMLGTLTLGLAACAGVGGGAPRQLGPALSIPPTSGVTCQDGTPVQINPRFPQPFINAGATSCLYLTFFGGEQGGVPGTAVSANIRVGPVTGPMRFVKLRILFQDNDIGFDRACCSAQEYGAVFTPAPNAVTTVPLNFQMVRDPAPTPRSDPLAGADLIGLEVLAPNVPIPGFWTQNGGGQLDLPTYVYAPALSTRVPAPSLGNMRSDSSFSGFQPTFNIAFVPR
jgi:hypothetical protein